MGLNNRGGVVLALGVTQTIAWASSYYLPAVLAAPMARDLGIGVPTVFAAFSFGLLISAVIGPYAGRAIDRAGGKPTLIATNIVFALGLAGLGWAQGVAGLFAAWALLGLGMGAGLYEAAFAAMVALYGKTARNAISGITLIAGFASTVGWPLSSYLDAQIGWRGACFTWAAVHVLLALPLNALLPAARRATAQAASPDSPENGQVPPDATRNAVLLSIVFAITWFISTAMAAHLPRLLVAAGASFAAAVAAGTLVGPAQVGGRLLELGVLRRIHPLLSARLAATAHPLGAAILLALGAPWASLFVLMHGAGNGIMTIAKGTLPLVLFGAHGYGAKQGVLMVPTRIAQAFAPWLFGLCLDRWGAGALWVSAGLGAVGFLALMALRSPAAEAPEPQDSRLPT